MSSPIITRLASSVRQSTVDGTGYNPGLTAPGLNLRFGTVVNYDPITMLIDIQQYDGGLILEGCTHFSNYIPTIGDVVYVLVFGPELIVMDRLADGGTGPSMFTNAAYGSGDSTLRSNADYAAAGDVNNIVFDIPPPFVFAGHFEDTIVGPENIGPVNIGVSGQIILAVSCYMQMGADGNGANATGTGYCSPWLTPTNNAYDVPPEVAFSCVYTGATGTGAMVSNLTIVQGFDPGPHDIRLICASMGALCYFGLQTIVAVPT